MKEKKQKERENNKVNEKGANGIEKELEKEK